MSAIGSETQARAWLIETLGVSRETLARLETFREFLLAEAAHQNLIAPSTHDHIWLRHFADSAQLLHFAPQGDGIWLDLGSGAGFPGIVIALLSDWPVVLVESRARRIDYLQRAVTHLGLERQVTVNGADLARVSAFPAAVISARAFAPLDRLLTLALRFSTENTCWLLPKGKNAVNEVETIAGKWHHLFHVEQSVTDQDAKILVGTVQSKA